MVCKAVLLAWWAPGREPIKPFAWLAQRLLGCQSSSKSLSHLFFILSPVLTKFKSTLRRCKCLPCPVSYHSCCALSAPGSPTHSTWPASELSLDVLKATSTSCLLKTQFCVPMIQGFTLWIFPRQDSQFTTIKIKLIWAEISWHFGKHRFQILVLMRSLGNMILAKGGALAWDYHWEGGGCMRFGKLWLYGTVEKLWSGYKKTWFLSWLQTWPRWFFPHHWPGCLHVQND